MRYIKRTWLAILVLSLSGLSGCTTNIADLEFCQIYEPIFADYDHDTQETIDQIDRNNLVYALYLKKPLLCGVGAFCCLNTFFR